MPQDPKKEIENQISAIQAKIERIKLKIQQEYTAFGLKMKELTKNSVLHNESFLFADFEVSEMTEDQLEKHPLILQASQINQEFLEEYIKANLKIS